jgi:hypothetical protein
MKKYFFTISVLIITCMSFSTVSFSQAVFEAGKISVTLSNGGRVRIYTPGEAGYVEQLDRLSILVGASSKYVFSYNEDADSVESSKVIATPKLSDYELFGRVDNRYSSNPPAVEGKINIYGWKDLPYTIVKFTIKNNDSTLKKFDAALGFEVLPKIDNEWGFETVKYYDSKKTAASFKDTSKLMVGVKILSVDLYSFKVFDWFEGYDDDSLNNSFFYTKLTTKSFDGSLTGGGDGTVFIMSQAAVSLPLGGESSYYVGIATGANPTELMKNMDLVQTKYAKISSIKQLNKDIPAGYNLEQNYPNPFNPATKINFNIPFTSKVILKIYNSLGQEISKLVDSELQAGMYSVDFSSKDLPSGLYFYTLSAGKYTQTKKMMVLK